MNLDRPTTEIVERAVLIPVPYDREWHFSDLMAIACQNAHAHGGVLPEISDFRFTVHQGAELYNAEGEQVYHNSGAVMLRLIHQVELELA